ncbi:MAG: hypothetical protein ABJF10_08500 [Chthoniobacter sp.]|uniref:hypothetical protein n=1 Tax=Chthoniobacter sp. TaxID=2510640 RepID=UPI0032A57A97
MKTLPALVALSFLVTVGTAPADTVKLPKSGALASLTFPDSWKVKAEGDNFEAESPDEEVYLYAEVIDTDSVEGALKESVAYLEKEKVQVKKGTEKQSKDTVNGIPVADFSFDGIDKDGPCKISLTILIVSKTKCISVLYWASEAGEKKHVEELKAIYQSIKPA